MISSFRLNDSTTQRSPLSLFRLILDPPREASLNMAVDEMLALSQSTENAQPTLRFYAWSEPSITTGYFQNVERVAQIFQASKKGIPVVRRLSGGGAVLHGNDLTFSFSLPVSNPFMPTDVKSSYLKINEVVRVGLKPDHPTIDYADCRTVPSGKRESKEKICFESPVCYDLLLSGRKILGSSQRRIGKCLLHQATLFLSQDKDLSIRRILEGFESSWKATFEERPLSREELSEAQKIEEDRYASSDWALFRERSFFS